MSARSALIVKHAFADTHALGPIAAAMGVATVPLAVGIPVLGEQLTAVGVAGLALILLGSWRATRAARAKRLLAPFPAHVAE